MGGGDCMNLITLTRTNLVNDWNGFIYNLRASYLRHVIDDITKGPGKVVIMGRKTFDELGRLPMRLNIVMTRDRISRNSDKDGVLYVHSIEECLAACRCYEQDGVSVIGGNSMYSQFFDYCDTAYIVTVDSHNIGKSKFPIDLWSMRDWESVNIGIYRTIGFELRITLHEFVRINKYDKFLKTHGEILNLMKSSHMFSISQNECDGAICINDACDGCYSYELTKETCVNLSSMFADLSKVVT